MAAKKKAHKKVAKKRKVVRKKAVAKKKRVTLRKKVAVNAPSRATGRAPSNRLKKRRRKDTVKGYYPNPASRSIVVAKIGNRLGYYTGKAFDTARSKALEFGDKNLVKTIARDVSRLPKVAAVGVFSNRDSEASIKAAFAPK
jgi:hypothetical protein